MVQIGHCLQAKEIVIHADTLRSLLSVPNLFHYPTGPQS